MVKEQAPDQQVLALLLEANFSLSHSEQPIGDVESIDVADLNQGNVRPPLVQPNTSSMLTAPPPASLRRWSAWRLAGPGRLRLSDRAQSMNLSDESGISNSVRN